MGPNPIKLEELLRGHKIPENAVVCDLGSGQGLTSAFLVKEYGFTVYAADLWSDPAENRAFFDAMGIDRSRIIPVKADAAALPFEMEFFDAVVSTDSYNYFGRDPQYLDEKLLPFVKHGGYLSVTVPGMKKDCHDHLPRSFCCHGRRSSWTTCSTWITGPALSADAAAQKSSPFRRWSATRRSGPTGWRRKTNMRWATENPWKPAAESI